MAEKQLCNSEISLTEDLGMDSHFPLSEEKLPISDPHLPFILLLNLRFTGKLPDGASRDLTENNIN